MTLTPPPPLPRRAWHLPLVSLVLIALSSLACAGGDDEKDDDDESTEDDGACGEFSTWDLEVAAKVEDARGAPLAGMRVYLDDLATSDPLLGEGETDAQGEVRFATPGVEFAEGCVGTLFDYKLIAEDPGGVYAEASNDMNSNLYNATLDGTLVADVRGVPLVMGEAE